MNTDAKLIYEAYSGDTLKKSMEWIKSKQHLIDEALDAVVSKMEDDSEKQSLQNGHGIYKGTCGHIITQCRCMRHHEPIIVDTLCMKCETGNADL